MTAPTDVRAWLFGGLVIDDILDRLEADGVAVRSAVEPGAIQRVLPLENYPLEIRRAALVALPAYLAFFCLENGVRDLVRERLAENHGADWWDSCAPTGIQTKVAQRREKEGASRWHARRGEHPIHYTDFGDLKSLITSNWADFEDLLPDQNWVTSRLDELEVSRNIIAHSNTLPDREVDRIRLYLDDWTRQVG